MTTEKEQEGGKPPGRPEGSTADPWLRQTLPPDLARHLVTPDPTNPVLRKWALQYSESLPLHRAALARLDRDWLTEFQARVLGAAYGLQGQGMRMEPAVDAPRDPRPPRPGPTTVILLRIRHEIESMLGQGLGWDTPKRQGVLAIGTAVWLAEKLTIDPVKWETLHRLDPKQASDLHGWLEHRFLPAWIEWILSHEPRPLRPDLLDRYDRLLDAVTAIAETDAGRRNLGGTLWESTPAFQALRAVLGTLDTDALRRAIDVVQQRREGHTASEFAKALLAELSETHTREIKELLAATGLEHDLALVWAAYGRWLAQHPAAVEELADRLGLSVESVE